MSEVNDDKIDLRPYFKLFRKVMSSIELWLYKNLGYIALSFLLLLGLFYIRDSFKTPRFKVTTVMSKEFMSSEELKSLMNSIKVNVEVNGAPEFFEQYEDKLGEDFNIYKINYSVLTSFKDSLVMKSTENNLGNLEDNGPVKVELVTNSDSDSMTEIFVDYLNTQPFVKNIRNSEIKFHEDRLIALNKEINNIDTIIEFLLQKEKGALASNHQNAQTLIDLSKENVFEFIKHKNMLEREKEEISNKLEFLSTSEIYLIGAYHQPQEINEFILFSAKSIIKILFLATFIVAFIAFVWRRLKVLKGSN